MCLEFGNDLSLVRCISLVLFLAVAISFQYQMELCTSAVIITYRIIMAFVVRADVDTLLGNLPEVDTETRSQSTGLPWSMLLLLCKM